MMDSDFMEFGDTGLVATEYGYRNIETGEKFDHDGNLIEEVDDGSTQKN